MLRDSWGRKANGDQMALAFIQLFVFWSKPLHFTCVKSLLVFTFPFERRKGNAVLKRTTSNAMQNKLSLDISPPLGISLKMFCPDQTLYHIEIQPLLRWSAKLPENSAHNLVFKRGVGGGWWAGRALIITKVKLWPGREPSLSSLITLPGSQ